ncbi:MAG: DUF2723 domain-containing protein [Elusimicrobia bacterium]|nr:DUF2723 domain-containing protein [Elusimicrobiota bacterium]
MFFLVFNFTFLIYLYTMYPTISPYRDSGDMIVSAFTYGIAHPPGYPLYVLLGKIFTVLIPLGNIAYKVNLMSAFFGALTCAVLYLLIKKIGEQIFSDKKSVLILCSLFAVFLFSLSSSMHSLSIVSEMYSMNALFTVLIDYVLITNYHLPLTAFLFGLGLGNHQTLVLLVPGIMYFLVSSKQLAVAVGLLSHKIWRIAIRPLLFFLLGFSIYLFLPIRSAQNPTANWGDPSGSIKNFYRVLTRADYGGVRLHPEKSPAEQNFSTVMKNFVNFLSISIEKRNGWAIVIIIFLALGIYFSFRKKLFWTLFLFWFFSGPVFFIISNLPLSDRTSLPILEPYLIMPMIIFTLFFAFGFFHLFSYLPKLENIKTVCFLIMIGIVFLITVVELPKLNKRYEFIGYDYSKDLLKTLPKNSVLFNPDDTTTFTLKYQQDCLNKRRDVKPAIFYKTLWGYGQIKKKYPEILPSYEMKSGIELETTLLSYNFNRLPFFSDNISKIPVNYNNVFPRGLLYGNQNIFEQMFNFYILPCRTCGKNRFFTNQIINYYSAGYNNLGLVFNEKKLYNKSIPLFEKAISVDPSLSQAYNNLGVVYWEKTDYEKAAEYFSQALKNAPNDEGVKRNLLMAQEKLKK